MINEFMFLITLFLITCVNVPMALVYLGRMEHRRLIQNRLNNERL